MLKIWYYNKESTPLKEELIYFHFHERIHLEFFIEDKNDPFHRNINANDLKDYTS